MFLPLALGLKPSTFHLGSVGRNWLHVAPILARCFHLFSYSNRLSGKVAVLSTQFTQLVKNRILLPLFPVGSFISSTALITCTLISLSFIWISLYDEHFSQCPLFLTGKKRSLQNHNQCPYPKNWIGFDYHGISWNVGVTCPSLLKLSQDVLYGLALETTTANQFTGLVFLSLDNYPCFKYNYSLGDTA